MELAQKRVDIDFDFFKNLLQNEQERVLADIFQKRKMLNGSFTTSPFGVHMAETGTDAMEKEKGFLFLQQKEKYLRAIKRALKRIDDGTYGICVKCEKPIPVERLEAVPVTTKCIDCKNGEF